MLTLLCSWKWSYSIIFYNLYWSSPLVTSLKGHRAWLRKGILMNMLSRLKGWSYWSEAQIINVNSDLHSLNTGNRRRVERLSGRNVGLAFPRFSECILDWSNFLSYLLNGVFYFRFGNAMQPDDDMDMVELSSWSSK